MWWIDSDNIIRIIGLQDTRTDAYINNATITGQLHNEAGEHVGGAISFSYVAGSDGDYTGLLPHSVVLTLEAFYTLEVTMVNTSAEQVFLKIYRQASYKGA